MNPIKVVFLSKSGHFFQVLKRAGETSSPPLMPVVPLFLVTLFQVRLHPQLQLSVANLVHLGISVCCLVRSSHRGSSARKGVLKNFPKFTEKHPCHILFFNKVASVRPVNFVKFSRITFLQNTQATASVWSLTAVNLIKFRTIIIEPGKNY